MNSTHFNISFTPLIEDIEIWNSFALEHYHVNVTDVFFPPFMDKTMDIIIPKDTHNVTFGPVEQDREYSLVIAGVTKSGLGVKSNRICVRTYQACKCLSFFDPVSYSILRFNLVRGGGGAQRLEPTKPTIGTSIIIKFSTSN